MDTFASTFTAARAFAKRSLVAGATILGFLSFTPATHAANLYWVGGNGDALNGNANDWSTTNPGACNNGGGDGTIPGASDVMIFDPDCDNGAIITSTMSVQGVSIQSGYTGQISQGSGNDVTIGSSGYTQAGGTWVGSAAGGTDITTTSFTITAGAFTAGDGNLSASTTVAITSGGGVTFTHNNGTFVLNGNADQAVNFGAKTLYNLTLNNTGGGNSDDIVIANGSTVVAAGNVLITLGNLDLITNTEAMTIAGNFTLANAAQATLGTNSDITVAGNITVNDAASITVNAGTLTLNGTADQTIDLDGQSLVNLTLNNTGGGTSDDIIIAADGQVILGGDLTVTAGNLDLATNSETMDVNGSITLADAAQATLTTDSNVNVTGNVTLGDAATMTVSAGTFTLDGTSDQAFDIDGQALYNLTINNTGGGTSDDIVVAGGDLDINGDLTVTLGNLDLATNSLAMDIDDDLSIANAAQASLTTNGAIVIAGDLALGASGVFTQSAGTTILDGTDQAITGSFTFPGLTKAVAASYTLTMEAGSTTIITNTLTLGGVPSGKLLVRSSSAGTTWSINPQGTRSVANLDVKDATNTNATTFYCGVSYGCVDSGNNTGWNFDVASSTSSGTSGGGGGRRSSGGGGGGGGRAIPTVKPIRKPIGTVKPSDAKVRREERLKIAKLMKQKALERAKERMMKKG